MGTRQERLKSALYLKLKKRKGFEICPGRFLTSAQVGAPLNVKKKTKLFLLCKVLNIQGFASD